VFATPIFDRCGTAARLPRTVLAAVLALLLLAPLSPRAARADEGVFTEFYSYLPATPELHMPEIDIPFWTDDFKKGKRAYKNGNYQRALKYFRRASDDGNMGADWYLGHMYRTGRGVPRDDATAYSYYSRVAELYDPEEPDQKRLSICVDAVVRIADYQRTGIASAGIAKNPATAARTYLRIATTYGHPAAQYALGIMNINGEGVKRNPQQGLKWLIAAARKRHAQSEAYLGNLYWEGKLVRMDRTRAVMWYILAQQSARPEENPEIFDRFDLLLASVSDEERLEAEARARVWADQYPAQVSRSASAEQ